MNNTNLPKTGDYIRVVSCPRKYDEADAFKGFTGEVTNHGDWLEIENMNGFGNVLIVPGKWLETFEYELI